MLAVDGAPSRARWAVMWVYVNKKGSRKVYRKDFGDDYASAHTLYMKAHDAGKPALTLACVNMGFPPPVELRPHQKRMVGRDRNTRKRKIVLVEVKPLKELNLQGKLWCPYCREMRPFVRKDFLEHNGIRWYEPTWMCPICKTSHRDYHVRYWNSTAVIHMDATTAVNTRRKRPPGTTRRRRPR